jgi:hypothetical protein
MRFATMMALVLASAFPATTVHSQTRIGGHTAPEKKAEAREAARQPEPGEGNPVPVAKPKASKEARQSAKVARKSEGAAESRGPHTGEGEGDTIPPAAAKVPKAARLAAREERKRETTRANKAGEITSKGERSY